MCTTFYMTRFSWVVLVVKNSPAKAGRCWFIPWVGMIPLEEGMATFSSVLAWRIPWTEEPGGLWSIGSQSQTQLKRLSMHAYIRYAMLSNFLKYKQKYRSMSLF